MSDIKHVVLCERCGESLEGSQTAYHECKPQPRRVSEQNPEPSSFTKPQSALNIQHGGDHYKSKGIQPWEYIVANNIGFFEGNVIKYITRYKDKNGLEDLKKARHYLDFLIEQNTKDN